MSGEHLPEDDVVGVRKIVVESISASKTEGHTVLTGDLRESERVNRGHGTTEVVEVRSDEAGGKVKVGVLGLDDILDEEVARVVGLDFSHI